MALFQTLPHDVVTDIARTVALDEECEVATRAASMYDVGGALRRAVCDICRVWTEVASLNVNVNTVGERCGFALRVCSKAEPDASRALARRLGHLVQRLDLRFAPLTMNLASFVKSHLPAIREVRLSTLGYGAHAECMNAVLAACPLVQRLAIHTNYVSRGLISAITENAPFSGVLVLDLENAYLPRTGLSFLPLWNAVKQNRVTNITIKCPAHHQHLHLVNKMQIEYLKKLGSRNLNVVVQQES